MYKTMNEVAEELGVTRMTVWTWAKKLEISGYASKYDKRVRLFSPRQQKELREAVLRVNRAPIER